MAEVKTISTEKLQQRLEQDNTLHLWNVLTDGYFTGEMIPGLTSRAARHHRTRSI